MLKITLRDSAERVRLELEGGLSGAWVPELEACWRASAADVGAREFWVDLSGVDSVYNAGRYLLALMHASGARFIASGCMTGALIREITGKWPVKCGSR